MKKLLIIGAGGLGREIYEYALEIQSHNRTWENIEFLDDNLNALDKYKLSHKLLGSIAEHVPKQNECFICAIGDSIIRTEICNEFIEKGANFTNIIHPTAYVSKTSNIGKGVIIIPRAMIFSNVKIGDFVVVNTLTTVGHDATIDKGCVLSAHCDVMGGAHLEDRVFLGSSAKILPGVRIGSNAKVGAGSVVLRNVKENSSVFGNPAKVIYSPKI